MPECCLHTLNTCAAAVALRVGLDQQQRPERPFIAHRVQGHFASKTIKNYHTEHTYGNF